ncbi:MAG: hypothetical protein A2Y24_04645 [Clostridiales bacterium GWE2_32_10]|nr:MAG: hypothetical protein A2Y24_04645 [Clostridiales bacterium GWE2_32_10]HBY21569.1 hypothetical protein [Clostridiales bacterium]
MIENKEVENYEGLLQAVEELANFNDEGDVYGIVGGCTYLDNKESFRNVKIKIFEVNGEKTFVTEDEMPRPNFLEPGKVPFIVTHDELKDIVLIDKYIMSPSTNLEIKDLIGLLESITGMECKAFSTAYIDLSKQHRISVYFVKKGESIEVSENQFVLDYMFCISPVKLDIVSIKRDEVTDKLIRVDTINKLMMMRGNVFMLTDGSDYFKSYIKRENGEKVMVYILFERLLHQLIFEDGAKLAKNTELVRVENKDLMIKGDFVLDIQKDINDEYIGNYKLAIRKYKVECPQGNKATDVIYHRYGDDILLDIEDIMDIEGFLDTMCELYRKELEHLKEGE